MLLLFIWCSGSGCFIIIIHCYLLAVFLGKLNSSQNLGASSSTLNSRVSHVSAHVHTAILLFPVAFQDTERRWCSIFSLGILVLGDLIGNMFVFLGFLEQIVVKCTFNIDVRPCQQETPWLASSSPAVWLNRNSQTAAVNARRTWRTWSRGRLLWSSGVGPQLILGVHCPQEMWIYGWGKHWS